MAAAIASDWETGLWSPACMDADELIAWTDRNQRLTGSARAAIPCEDCTLGYAAEMRLVGRCNGTPGGVEEEDMEAPVTLVAVVSSRASVTVSAPCGTCVHARVCRLRPPDVLDVRAELPAIAGELTVTLTAIVECMEYSRAPRTKARVSPVSRATAYGHPHTPETREKLRLAAIARAERQRAEKES